MAIQDSSRAKMIGTFQPKILLFYAKTAIFHDGKAKDGASIVASDHATGMAISKMDVAECLSTVFLWNCLALFGIIAAVLNSPLGLWVAQDLKGVMSVLVVFTAISAIVLCYASMKNRTRSERILTINAMMDFIHQHIFYRMSDDEEKTQQCMLFLYRLLSDAGIKETDEMIKSAKLDPIFDEFEARQDEILGKQGFDIKPDRIDRSDPSAWSIWLKMFIGQNFLKFILALPSQEYKDNLQINDKTMLNELEALAK